MHFGWLEIHAVDHCNSNCRWCHNYAPFAPKKNYSACEYFDGLDLLTKNKAEFGAISIMGGEPFLHPNLMKFAYDLLLRYKKPLMITTNGFWLGKEAVEYYKDLWPLLSTMRISRYPLIEKRLGGVAYIREMMALIKKYNPSIYIDFPNKGRFNKLEFFDQPVEVELFCGNAECTALLPDMRMARCGAGGYAHLAPAGHLSDGFADSKHMFYDLTQFDMRTFSLWRKRYPLDACSYCSFSLPSKSGSWKVESGKAPFNKDYELEYYISLGKGLLCSGLSGDIPTIFQFVRNEYGKVAEVHLLEAYSHLGNGDKVKSLHCVELAHELAPESTHVQECFGVVHNL